MGYIIFVSRTHFTNRILEILIMEIEQKYVNKSGHVSAFIVLSLYRGMNTVVPQF